MEFQGKKIVVVGMGKSGMAAVRVLHERGADVVANDSKSAEIGRQPAIMITASKIAKVFVP